jgi:hypothetical protein
LNFINLIQIKNKILHINMSSLPIIQNDTKKSNLLNNIRKSSVCIITLIAILILFIVLFFVFNRQEEPKEINLVDPTIKSSVKVGGEFNITPEVTLFNIHLMLFLISIQLSLLMIILGCKK